jgi:hypothetical protein
MFEKLFGRFQGVPILFVNQEIAADAPVQMMLNLSFRINAGSLYAVAFRAFNAVVFKRFIFENGFHLCFSWRFDLYHV